MRHIALEEQIKDISHLETNYNEKTERKKAGLRRVKHDDDDYMDDEDDDSNDFSDFDSEASRVNFWKQIAKEE